jgi:hypothetical protein
MLPRVADTFVPDSFRLCSGEFRLVPGNSEFVWVLRFTAIVSILPPASTLDAAVPDF